MAFRLVTADPGEKVSGEIKQCMDERDQHPLFGLNVSGLVALSRAGHGFALKANYVEALVTFVDRLMGNSDARMLLIPHVMSPAGDPEADEEACQLIRDKIDGSYRSRIRISPRNLDESEVKWVIAHTDWFCGTRMHATIAALSSGVPAAAVAYSDKTLGVFQSCGVGDQVVDPRRLGTKEVVDALLRSLENRAQTKQILAKNVPEVKARATDLFSRITSMLQRLE